MVQCHRKDQLQPTYSRMVVVRYSQDGALPATLACIHNLRVRIGATISQIMALVRKITHPIAGVAPATARRRNLRLCLSSFHLPRCRG